MLSFKKGNAYRSRNPIAMKGPGFTELPTGTGFVCVRGGRNPRLGFQSPVGNAFYALVLPMAELHQYLEAATLDSVPQSLLDHLNLSPVQPTPRFSKGSIVSVVTPFEVAGETYPKGAYLKCEKGGVTPHFLVRRPSDNELISVSLQGSYLLRLTATAPRIDNALRGITHNVTADYSATEESIALSGTITLPDGWRVAVECRGGGDPVTVHSLGRQGRQPEKRLDQLINTALTDAGINPADVWEVDSLFANYLAQTYGMETFGEYARYFMQHVKSVSA